MRAVAVLLIVCAAAGAVWSGACSQVRPPEAGSEAADIYTSNCSECHGVDGGGLKAPSLRTGISASQVQASLTGGVEAHNRALDAKLSPQQIATVSAYVERMGEAGDHDGG